MSEADQVEGLKIFLKQTSKHSTPSALKKSGKWDSQPATSKSSSPRKGAFLLTKHQHFDELAHVRSHNILAQDASKQTTKEWLNVHGLSALGLTPQDLIAIGKLPLEIVRQYDERIKIGDEQVLTELRRYPPSSLDYDLETINEFECNLHTAISDYASRIKWMMQGTRKVFGLIRGRHIGLLIDASNANLSYGRWKNYRDHLVQLFKEQLNEKLIDTLYVASYGTRVESLWPCPMKVNYRSLEEADAFVRREMQSSGSSNLMSGIKHMFMYGRRKLDCLIILCGSCPDQDGGNLIDYMEQISAGYNTPRLHLVAYDCRNWFVNQFLAEMANIHDNSTYHCYSSTENAAIQTSDEIAGLVGEIRDAQNVLDMVKQARLKVDRPSVIAENAVQQAVHLIEVATKSPVHHLPQPPDHGILYGPLKLDTDRIELLAKRANWPQKSTSREWLAEHGIKSRKLDLFQVLASNAYSQVVGYIPSIRRSVSAQIHQQCMAQMRWPDGTIKNVHVDLTQLFEYQKQLRNLVDLLEKRVHWLTKESRGYFGTIVEPHVVLLIDLSQQNAVYLVHIHYCLRHVLEQQVAKARTFNILVIGSEVITFRTGRVAVTVKNLQAAWDWIRGLHCTGSRNILGGLRHSLENEPEINGSNVPQGLYLFTSGVPDQESSLITSYLEEKLCARPHIRLHVALYNVDDYDIHTGYALPSRYANITKTVEVFKNIAHCTGGRFHWFRETGIIESDDIQALLNEIDMIVEYSKQCQLLVEESRISGKGADGSEKSESAQSYPIMQPIATPIVQVGQNMKAITSSVNPGEKPPRSKTSAKLRHDAPGKSKSVIKIRSKSDPMKPAVRMEQELDIKNKEMKVASEHCKSTPTSASRCTVPKEEERITSLQWLRKYSVRNLGLSLKRLLSGAACRHKLAYSGNVGAQVEARYCAGLFPIVNISGTLRHLHYTWGELEHFKIELSKLLRRYITRLDWLLSGSRRHFGVITEQCVVMLLDLSGSMEPRLDELKYQLKQLVWDQFFKYHIMFNMIAFNSDLIEWRPIGPTIADESACHDAVAWIDQLEAEGGTSIEAAIFRAVHHLDAVDRHTGLCPNQRRPAWMDRPASNNCKSQDHKTSDQAVSRAIYLLTDGKPDISRIALLKLISDTWKLNPVQSKTANNKTESMKHDSETDLPYINTVTDTTEEEATAFLRKLSRMTNGRHHIMQSDHEIEGLLHQYKEKLLNTPSPQVDIDKINRSKQSDDVNQIQKEMNTIISNLRMVDYFQNVYKDTKYPNSENY